MDQETRGRLHLWALALFECESILKDAIRAKKTRDGQPLPPSGEVDEIYRTKPFGEWIDLDSVFHNYVILASILFCQIFKQGKSVQGMVAANKSKAIEAHRRSIVSDAFRKPQDLERFKRLLAQLTDARNMLLAHADGEAFAVSHGDQMVVSRTFSSVVQEVPVEYFRRVVTRLRRVVRVKLAASGTMTGWTR